MGRGSVTPPTRCCVSVRSGAKFSMPGMMDTILNLGLNDETRRGPGRGTGDERFALDSYRRFIQMYGTTCSASTARRFDARSTASTRTRLADARSGRALRPWPSTRSWPRPAQPFPQDAGNAAAGRGRGGVPLVEHAPGRRLPAPGADPRRLGHGGERAGHGVRQPRRPLGHRRGLHPRPGHRRRGCTATSSSTPRARTSSPASATPCR